MGAMHTPDINILKPVFLGKRLYAWTGATAHHLDVGGVNPGTEGPDLREIYAEGVVLPPVRLYQQGEENPDLFDVLTESVRDPASTISDLRAQRAACLLGERRLLELVERYGERTVAIGFASGARCGRASDAGNPSQLARRGCGSGGIPRRRRPRRAADQDPCPSREAKRPSDGRPLGVGVTGRRRVQRAVGEHPGRRGVRPPRDDRSFDDDERRDHATA